jgi:charged multivesicular body protein 3
MEKVLGVFKPKSTPQEQLREWQRKLRQQSRDVDRQVRGESLVNLLSSVRFVRK